MKTREQRRTGTSLIALALVALLGLGSCDQVNCIKGEGDVVERTLELDAIREVETNGSYRVYLTPGPVQRVQVKGQANILDQLRTDVHNGKWKIEHRSCVRRSKEVEVHITLPELRSVYLNGSGSITSQGKFTATEMVVHLNGSGRVDLEAEASKIISTINGSGHLSLEGRTNDLRQSVTGSGKAALYEMAATEANVTVAGSGVAEVNASDRLIVRIDGSGKVYYAGTPAYMSQEINGSGKVTKR